MPDNKILHAAKVMAEYLDNDENGAVDNTAVVNAMVAAKAFLYMASSESEEESILDSLPLGGPQNLFEFETRPEGSSSEGFDATLEEVLHLISVYGYARAHPAAFAESVSANSSLTRAMDTARGGKFTSIPNPYPAGAWYTYGDETCDYRCMAAEYFYWLLTSILGAQDYTDEDGGDRASDIEEEWRLTTRAQVEETDSAGYALMTDAQYLLPTKIPNGEYLGGTVVLGGSLISANTVEWPSPYNGVTPDSSYGLGFNNIGVLNSSDATIYVCLRIFTEGLPSAVNGVSQFDMGLKVASLSDATVQITKFREFNAISALNEKGQLPDCSGMFETTTGVYTDIIQTDTSVLVTTWNLIDPTNLILKLGSFKELTAN